MFNGKLLNKKSVAFTWIISYIIIFLLPTIISCVVYLRMKEIIADETNRSNRFFLSQIQHNIDSIINDIHKLNTEITFDTRIQEVMRLKNNQDYTYNYKLYEGVKSLAGYKRAYSSIDEIYIYIKSLDTIISDNYVLDSKEFYNFFYKQKGISYDKWLQNLNSYHKEVYTGFFDNEGVSKSIEYMQSLPVLRQDDFDINLVISIDQNKYMDMTKEFEEINKGNVLILDESNNILASSAPISLPKRIDYEALHGNNIINENINGENVVLSSISSQVGHLEYVYIMPTKVFLQKVQNAQKLIIISIVFCLFLGSVAAYILLKKNYKPVKELVQYLSSHYDNNNNIQFNEYGYIKQAVLKNLSEKNEIEQKLIDQKTILRIRFIENLLKGKVLEGEVKDLLSSFNMNFATDYFAVMIFYVEECEINLMNNEKEEFIEPIKFAQFVVANVVSDLIGQCYTTYMVEVDDLIFSIINVAELGVSDEKEKLRQIASEAHDFIKKRFSMRLKIGISNIHKTFTGINQAYNETLEIMEFNIVMGIDGIVQYDEIREVNKSNFFYPIDKEQEIINYVKVGDYLRANSVIQEIFRENFESRNLSPYIAKCLIFNIGGTILKTINEIDILHQDEFLQNVNPMEELIPVKNINTAKKCIEDILKKLCDYIIKSNENEDSCEIKLLVARYIDNNYQDKNLSVSSIGDHFNLHPTYISRIFKLQAQEGILDYINKIRIINAKKLMRDRSLNLEEISDRVGYSSVRTFTRSFSKIEGITPGKFRELY